MTKNYNLIRPKTSLNCCDWSQKILTVFQLYRIGLPNLFAMRRTHLGSYYCFVLILAL